MLQSSSFVHRVSLCIVLCAVFCAALFPLSSRAQDAAKTMIVLDGSRSMWSRLKKVKKYRSARFLLRKILDNPPHKDPIGVIAFGSSRRSCKRIQIIKPVDAVWSDQHAAKLRKYKPRGRSPVATALESAAQLLDYRNKAAKIIMIVDGPDNCRRNPCEALRGLREDAKDLSVQLIGLGMNKRSIKKYRCFSQHPSDAFYPVKDASEFISALLITTGGPQAAADEGEIAVKKYEYQPPKVDQEQIASNLKGAPRVKLFAVLSEGRAPLREGVSWRIYKAKKDSSLRSRPTASSNTSQPEFRLKPGDYIAEATYDRVRVEQHIAVPKSGALTHIIDLKAGLLQVETKEQADGKLVSGVFYALYEIDESSNPKLPPIARSNKASTRFHVPAGTYLLTATHGGHKLEKMTTVYSGSKTVLSLQMNIGILKLSTVTPKNTTPIKRMFYSIYRDDGSTSPKEQANGNQVAHTGSSQPELRLPAGRYIIKAEHDLAHIYQRVLIETGKTNKVKLVLNASTLSLKSAVKGKKGALKNDVSYKLERIVEGGEASPEEVARTTDAEKTYVVTPGAYRITGRYGSINATETQELKLTTVLKKTLVLNHNAGTAELALIDKRGGFPRINVFWTIYDDRGLEIWRTSRPTPRLILKKGGYKVVAESDNTRYEREFKVETGTNADIKLKSK